MLAAHPPHRLTALVVGGGGDGAGVDDKNVGLSIQNDGEAVL